MFSATKIDSGEAFRYPARRRRTRCSEREVEELSLAQSTLRGRRSRLVDKPWRQASGGEKEAAGGAQILYEGGGVSLSF